MRVRSWMGVLLLPALLTGCTAVEAAPAATSTPTVAGLPAYDRCDPDQGPHLADDALVDGALRMSPFEKMRDLGATEHAAGKATLRDGRPTSYVVAPGDTTYAVMARFCMDNIMLNALNAVRREPTWLSGDASASPVLYAGDTLNLDPHTITSVGDQKGVVYDNTPTFALPPQE